MSTVEIGGFWMYMKEIAVFLHLSRINLFDADINSSGIFIISSFVLLFRGSPSGISGGILKKEATVGFLLHQNKVYLQHNFFYLLGILFVQIIFPILIEKYNTYSFPPGYLTL